jgi:hypothetical protein
MNVIAAFAVLTAVLSFGEAWGDVPPAQDDAKSSPIDLVNRTPKGKLHNPYKDTDTNIVSQWENCSAPTLVLAVTAEAAAAAWRPR